MQSALCLYPRTIANPIRLGLALLLVTLTYTSAGRRCLAQAISDPPVQADEAQSPEMSRQEWREKIEEARRRAKEVAIDRRNNPPRYEIIPEDPARVATDRVLNDESLQRGDIVSTDKGLFIFRGRSDSERRHDDFIPLPTR